MCSILLNPFAIHYKLLQNCSFVSPYFIALWFGNEGNGYMTVM